ncbi:MAG: cob(I)yrinic acid a,c-diamide adenosyltransferase [Nitrosarchaeum sp.]
MKIYTKTGDSGTTGLQGGFRVSKSHPRIMAYGTIDEANAGLGIALSNKFDQDITAVLIQIQNELFIVGSDLSNPDSDNKKNRVTLDMVLNLEKHIDKYEEELPPLTNFILPGGNIIAAQIHYVRTVIRRAETYMILLNEQEKINQNCIKYVNRLSDLFFVLGRVLNKRNNQKDIIWKV